MKVEELKDCPQWLRNAKTKSADVVLNECGQVVWLGGTWHGGTWYGSEWHGGEWRGGEWYDGEATMEGKRVAEFKCLLGLYYPYCIVAYLFEDGTRGVRMGCLYKSIDDWDKVGIRNSNLEEFPDDGSEKSENRAWAFDVAKSCALRLKARKNDHLNSSRAH